MQDKTSEFALSLFFQANSLSLFSRIHLLVPRTGLFDETPHGLTLELLQVVVNFSENMADYDICIKLSALFLSKFCACGLYPRGKCGT